MGDLNATANTIINAIKPLAEKIGQGAAALYTIYVRQQYIQGLTELIFGCLAGIVVVTLAIIGIRTGKKMLDDDDYDDAGPILIFFSIIGGLIGLALFFGFGVDGLQHLLNPQYFAIQDIINTVTGRNND